MTSVQRLPKWMQRCARMANDDQGDELSVFLFAPFPLVFIFLADVNSPWIPPTPLAATCSFQAVFHDSTKNLSRPKAQLQAYRSGIDQHRQLHNSVPEFRQQESNLDKCQINARTDQKRRQYKKIRVRARLPWLPEAELIGS